MMRRDDPTPLPLGTRVAVRATLCRTTDQYDGRTMKRWASVPCLVITSDWIVIGYRTLSDGRRDWTGDGIMYTSTHTFRAVLIVRSLYQKPQFARIDDIARVTMEATDAP